MSIRGINFFFKMWIGSAERVGELRISLWRKHGLLLLDRALAWILKWAGTKLSNDRLNRWHMTGGHHGPLAWPTLDLFLNHSNFWLASDTHLPTRLGPSP